MVVEVEEEEEVVVVVVGATVTEAAQVLLSRSQRLPVVQPRLLPESYSSLSRLAFPRGSAPT